MGNAEILFLPVFRGERPFGVEDVAGVPTHEIIDINAFRYRRERAREERNAMQSLLPKAQE